VLIVSAVLCCRLFAVAMIFYLCIARVYRWFNLRIDRHRLGFGVSCALLPIYQCVCAVLALEAWLAIAVAQLYAPGTKVRLTVP